MVFSVSGAKWTGGQVALLSVLAVMGIVSRYCGALLLWGWFVAPFFHLPALSVSILVGWEFFIGMVKPRADTASAEDKSSREILEKSSREILEKSWNRLVGIWVYLGFGWVLHYCM
jgi:hypothetical protein